MRRRRREIASRGRRLAAGAVDGLIMISLVSVGTLVWSRLSQMFVRSVADQRAPMACQTCEVGGAGPASSSRAGGVIGSAVSRGLEIGLRNQRTPGARLLGIRRVNASTGGPLSIRNVIIHQLASRVLTAPIIELVRPVQRREAEHLEHLAPRIKEIEQEHEGDPQALQRAMMAFYNDNKVNPFRGCVLAIAGPMAARALTIGSTKKQTLPDRLAGIIVVRG